MVPPDSSRSARRVGAVVIAFVSASLLSCSGDEPSAPKLGFEDPRPEFITDGVPTGENFGNVGAAFFDFDASGTIDGFETFCSGSLIAPTVFLTAAHCVFLFPPDAQLYVSFDPALLPGPPNVIAAEAFHFDPSFGHDQANLHDLAVIILPTGSTSGITPLALPPAGLLDDLAARGGLRGELFVNVGYGFDASQQGRPSFAFDGLRRTSKSPFKGLTQYWLNLHVNTNKTGEGGSCIGDSGSPHFLDGNPGLAVATITGGDRVCRALNYNYRLDTEPARAFLGQFVGLP